MPFPRRRSRFLMREADNPGGPESGVRPPGAMEARRAFLRDGTPVVTRPITPRDGPALARGLRRLSPQGNAFRFLHFRKRFTEQELHYLTHCDFANHLALVLARTDSRGHEIEEVGAARCIRLPEDPETAEAAIVLVDDWHRQGGGTLLLRHLADLALQAGIRKWQTLMFQENVASERLFARVADEISRRPRGYGISEILYALSPEGGTTPDLLHL
jgi:GNAT superfamily N-acetyltransferase